MELSSTATPAAPVKMLGVSPVSAATPAGIVCVAAGLNSVSVAPPLPNVPSIAPSLVSRASAGCPNPLVSWRAAASTILPVDWSAIPPKRCV